MTHNVGLYGGVPSRAGTKWIRTSSWCYPTFVKTSYRKDIGLVNGGPRLDSVAEFLKAYVCKACEILPVYHTIIVICYEL